MFGAFHVTVDGDSETVLQAAIRCVAIRRNNRTIRIVKFGRQQEDVGAGVGGQGVHVLEHTGPNALGGSVHDQVHIHVDGGASLVGWRNVSKG